MSQFKKRRPVVAWLRNDHVDGWSPLELLGMYGSPFMVIGIIRVIQWCL